MMAAGDPDHPGGLAGNTRLRGAGDDQRSISTLAAATEPLEPLGPDVPSRLDAIVCVIHARMRFSRHARNEMRIYRVSAAEVERIAAGEPEGVDAKGNPL